MRRFTFTLFILLLATFAVFAQQEHYFKFEIKERAELEDITRMISIDNVEGNTVYAYANEQQLENFKQKTGYVLRMLEHPGSRAKNVDMATTVEEMSNWDKYPTYDVYVQMMNDFADDYPDIASLQNIGTTLDGRDLLVLKISDNVDQQEDEPEFFYTSTMHGDETAGFVFMLRFIDSLLTNYGEDPEITDYLDNIAIYVNPNANPDGTYQDDNSTVSGATRGNANGVDLNRNFPDPDDGPHPDGEIWQPETEAMMDFAEQHHFTLSANFHGGAEVANYPWDTWSRDHVDNAWLKHASYVYANPAIDNSPSGYFTGTSSDGIINGYDWYTITGGRQDFMNYFHQCREITMEVSSQKLLSTDDLRDYWDYNKQSLFDYMEQSLYGIRGIVNGENGDPLEAMIEIEGHDS
ncbi:MAG: M14 family zinc carboxypeptidase, partial [Bacteroidota bacterium]